MLEKLHNDVADVLDEIRVGVSENHNNNAEQSTLVKNTIKHAQSAFQNIYD